MPSICLFTIEIASPMSTLSRWSANSTDAFHGFDVLGDGFKGTHALKEAILTVATFKTCCEVVLEICPLNTFNHPNVSLRLGELQFGMEAKF